MHLCQLHSVQSVSAQEGTCLTCALEQWFGLCTLELDEDVGLCILQGCRSEVEQTGLRHKAVPLCQEVL